MVKPAIPKQVMWHKHVFDEHAGTGGYDDLSEICVENDNHAGFIFSCAGFVDGSEIIVRLPPGTSEADRDLYLQALLVLQYRSKTAAAIDSFANRNDTTAVADLMERLDGSLRAGTGHTDMALEMRTLLSVVAGASTSLNVMDEVEFALTRSAHNRLVYLTWKARKALA